MHSVVNQKAFCLHQATSSFKSVIMVERAKRAKPFSTLVEITPSHSFIKSYYVDTRFQKMSKKPAVVKSDILGSKNEQKTCCSKI